MSLEIRAFIDHARIHADQPYERAEDSVGLIGNRPHFLETGKNRLAFVEVYERKQDHQFVLEVLVEIAVQTPVEIVVTQNREPDKEQQNTGTVPEGQTG